VTQTLALIQPWIDYVPKRQRRLGLFIFLALLAHLVTFFFIRLDTTRAELRHQSRIHVTMENRQAAVSSSPAGNDFWDRLADPRLYLLPLHPFSDATSGDHTLDFIAINSNIGSPEMPPPAQAANYQFIHEVVSPLDQRAAAALTPQRQPFSYDETPPAVAAKTAWQWDRTLVQRRPANEAELPSPVSDTELGATELRVAVDAHGTVAYVLLEQSCQKPELDQQAILAARKTRFQPVDTAGLLWGRATIFWHYTPTPRKEVVPTPPSGP